MSQKLTSNLQVIATPDGNFAIAGLTPSALADVCGAVTQTLCPTEIQAVLFASVLDLMNDPKRLEIAMVQAAKAGHNPQLVELLVLVRHNEAFCESDRSPFKLSSDVGVKPDEAAGS